MPEIQDFCRLTYGVDFPVFSKIAVKGGDADPLYKALTERLAEDAVQARQQDGRAATGRRHGRGMEFRKVPGRPLMARSSAASARMFAPQDKIIVDAVEAQLAA